MISENTVRLKGRVYRYEVRELSTGKQFCSFGLQFYNGKDKEGNPQYFFANCRGTQDYKLKDKQDVIVNGRYAGVEYTDKKGNKIKQPFIFLNKENGIEFIEECPL